MRAETLAGAVGLAALVLGTLSVLPAAPVSPLPLASRAFSAPSFPPARAARDAARPGAAVPALDAEVARLGRARPRLESLRRAFQDSGNLLQFALDRLPQAVAGDGASQYFIYLALDQCRSYLRNDFDSAGAQIEQLMSMTELTTEERNAWRAEYARCRAFLVGDWAVLGDALGDDKPGAEIEFASVWFERAAQAGYGPALAEQALRPSAHGADERADMLRAALASRSADVFWLLFAHSGEVQVGEINAPALAWLLVACRAGQDCSGEARWYRGFVCAQDEHRCREGQSAIGFYWQSATAAERVEAWTQAIEMEQHLSDGRWDALPLPELESRDYRRLWDEGPE